MALTEEQQLQQSLKDQLCALIQRDDVLVLQVDYEDSENGFPAAINIQYEESTTWK